MLVDDSGNVIDPREQWCLQTPLGQDRTMSLMTIFKEALVEEYGPYSTQRLASGRVLLIPDSDELPMVYYLSDEIDQDALLVGDDVTAEIWPNWWPENPPPKPIKPKNLSAT